MLRSPKAALAIAALLGAGAARGAGFQESGRFRATLVAAAWEAAAPQQDLRDFVDRTSPRGLLLELEFGVARHLSLGVAGSWNWMSQGFPEASLRLPYGDISGKGYRRLQVVALEATAAWYLTDGPIQPFLGVGAGGGSHATYVAVADVVRTSSGWHASAGPRAGILYSFRPGLAVKLQARYVFTNARIGDVEKARWLAFDLGLAAH